MCKYTKNGDHNLNRQNNTGGIYNQYWT